LRHLVVGTAGHIDHGKSALVESLTGVHPDRLDEERRRGITIDLGFADCDLSPHGVVSIVDVPGHERFVRHMVAGASGLDAVMLVIAADEGVKPQTREHLAIGSLLGLTSGLVVLSKADLADSELRELVASEVRDLVSGTFLDGAPIIPVSARTGEGLQALRAALVDWLQLLPERSPHGVPRLPIDRSFVLRGFGTVVTGTLAAGVLREGQDVEILPGGRRGRIRGLQVHKRKEVEVHAGRRVAVNLQGLDRDDAPRGATLTAPGALRPTRRAHVRVELLAIAPAALSRGGPVRFHQGTCERSARMRSMRPTGAGIYEAELHFGEDTVLLPGDRFILRRPAPVDTVGGGVVLDAHPVRVRSVPGAPRLEDGIANPWIERIARGGVVGRSAASVSTELGRSAAELDVALGPLVADARVVRAGGVLFDGLVWRRVREGVAGALEEFHASEPLAAGLPREALRARVARPMPRDAFRVLLEELAAEGIVTLSGDLVAVAGFRVVLSPMETAQLQRIEDAFRRAALDPPPAADVAREVGGDLGSKFLRLLIERGRLEKIRDGRLFHAEALEELRRKLREFGRTSSTIDIGAFKELAGVTRKNAIPLLEQFDQERLTRREGSVRRIVTDEAAR
jgi:selenocysteine-specific elongation factor